MTYCLVTLILLNSCILVQLWVMMKVIKIEMDTLIFALLKIMMIKMVIYTASQLPNVNLHSFQASKYVGIKMTFINHMTA